MKREVTPDDLAATGGEGWVCEACGRPFAVGDLALGVELNGLAHDWRCQDCFDNGRPIIEQGFKGRTYNMRWARLDHRDVFTWTVVKYREGVS